MSSARDSILSSAATKARPEHLRRWATVQSNVWLLAGLSGLRLDRPRPAAIAVWVALLAASVGVQYVNDVALTCTLFGLSCLYYYVGNALVLGTRLRTWAIARWGPRRAFEHYEALVGSMFAAQGLGVAAMSALDRPGWVLPSVGLPHVLAGAALCVVGFGVRWWAARLIGLDGVYYRDLFLREPATMGPLGGPYRWLSNPMYGVGQLHAWGFALMQGSLAGLLAAGLCHLAIYAFYAAVERPFAIRAYACPASRSAPS